VKSLLADISTGDLAAHTRRANLEGTRSVERVGLVINVNPVLGSGFRSADIMWCEDGKVETVMLHYLKPVQKI